MLFSLKQQALCSRISTSEEEFYRQPLFRTRLVHLYPVNLRMWPPGNVRLQHLLDWMRPPIGVRLQHLHDRMWPPVVVSFRLRLIYLTTLSGTSTFVLSHSAVYTGVWAHHELQLTSASLSS